MRIHSDTLGERDFQEARAHVQTIWFAAYSNHGSRKRRHAFEIQLCGTSVYAAQSGMGKAATWDEWGEFLAFLFDCDPSMIAGPYDGRDDFIEQAAETIERNVRYEEIVGRKRPGMTAPWLGVTA